MKNSDAGMVTHTKEEEEEEGAGDIISQKRGRGGKRFTHAALVGKGGRNSELGLRIGRVFHVLTLSSGPSFGPKYLSWFKAQ